MALRDLSRVTTSLDATVGEGDTTLGELHAERTDDLDEEVLERQREHAVEAALAKLPEPERRMIARASAPADPRAALRDVGRAAASSQAGPAARGPRPERPPGRRLARGLARSRLARSRVISWDGSGYSTPTPRAPEPRWFRSRPCSSASARPPRPIPLRKRAQARARGAGTTPTRDSHEDEPPRPKPRRATRVPARQRAQRPADRRPRRPPRHLRAARRGAKRRRRAGLCARVSPMQPWRALTLREQRALRALRQG